MHAWKAQKYDRLSWPIILLPFISSSEISLPSLKWHKLDLLWCFKASYLNQHCFSSFWNGLFYSTYKLLPLQARPKPLTNFYTPKGLLLLKASIKQLDVIVEYCIYTNLICSIEFNLYIILIIVKHFRCPQLAGMLNPIDTRPLRGVYLILERFTYCHCSLTPVLSLGSIFVYILSRLELTPVAVLEREFYSSGTKARILR